MGSEIRECVKALEGGKAGKERLQDYVRESVRLHAGYETYNLMMDYYLFYETISEEGPYASSVEKETEALNRILRDYLEKSGQGCLAPEEAGELEGRLSALREEIIEKVKVLTAYVDRFVIYEYVLNRIQYRFEDQEMMPGDEEFIHQVISYIFGSEDNVIVNNRIREVLGQLPMRMTRKHYYDLVRDSISLYKGSQKNALEGYLYMFRTNAMIYQTEGMKKYFTEFVADLEELASLDYEKLGEQGYRIYEEKIRKNASKLTEITDLYMLLIQLANQLYSIVLAAGRERPVYDIPKAEKVVRGINDLFLEQTSHVWEEMGEELSTATEEEKLEWLGKNFPGIEGRLEAFQDGVTMADSALDGIMEDWQDAIREQGLEEAFSCLKKMACLSSNSNFVELASVEDTGKVTPELAEEETERLVGELKAVFQNSSRMVRRSIMANTLEKMPVFFTTSQEVVDYICQSLSLCEDEAEKYASKQLIQGLMEYVQEYE